MCEIKKDQEKIVINLLLTWTCLLITTHYRGVMKDFLLRIYVHWSENVFISRFFIFKKNDFATFFVIHYCVLYTAVSPGPVDMRFKSIMIWTCNIGSGACLSPVGGGICCDSSVQESHNSWGSVDRSPIILIWTWFQQFAIFLALIGV